MDLLSWNKQYLKFYINFETKWLIEIELSEEVIKIIGIDDYPKQ